MITAFDQRTPYPVSASIAPLGHDELARPRHRDRVSRDERAPFGLWRIDLDQRPGYVATAGALDPEPGGPGQV
jgi:hypothetical protein